MYNIVVSEETKDSDISQGKVQVQIIIFLIISERTIYQFDSNFEEREDEKRVS